MNCTTLRGDRGRVVILNKSLRIGVVVAAVLLSLTVGSGSRHHTASASVPTGGGSSVSPCTRSGEGWELVNSLGGHRENEGAGGRDLTIYTGWAGTAPCHLVLVGERAMPVEIGFSGGAAYERRGVILLSDDGGVTVRDAVLPPMGEVRDVTFRDDRVGWAVGSPAYVNGRSTDTFLLRTDDGGETWLSVPFNGGGTERIRYSAGRLWSSTLDRLLRSDDEGRSWIEALRVPGRPATGPYGMSGLWSPRRPSVRDISTLDRTIVVAGEDAAGGWVFISSDGGETFVPIDEGATIGSPRMATVASLERIFVAGYDPFFSGDHRRMLRIDYAESAWDTWEPAPPLPDERTFWAPYATIFITPNEGYVSLWYSILRQGTWSAIARTVDGGATWAVEPIDGPSPTPGYVWSLFADQNGTVYGVGTAGLSARHPAVYTG